MSVDTSVYVGPFAACRNHTIAGERKVRACPKEGCRQFFLERYDKNIKFCENCGSPIEDCVVSTLEYQVSRGDLHEELQNDMTIAGWERGFGELGGEKVDVWIGNIRGGVGQNYDPKYQEFCYIPDFKHMQEEIEKFEEEHRDSLTALREAYGVENVEVKWGVLGWLS